MFGLRKDKGRDAGTGVLAGRLATAQACHPRVPEVTAGAALAASPRPVAILPEGATVGDALRAMADGGASAVAVTSSSSLTGIVSERDHARAAALGRARDDAPVASVMSRDAAAVAPSDSVRRCLALLAERRVTHAVVLDGGKVVGLLSEVDLLRAQVAWHERVFHEIEVDQKLLFLRGTYSC